ncbi:MAG: pyridoxal phosphate-dependent aminotransferase, partial [Candidatus Latescibacterota bacterium]
GFAYPNEQILAAISEPRALRYEPDPRGLLSAREVLGRRLGGIDPSRIVLSASTSEAYSWLFKLLADEGDEVLVAAPSYPLFDFLAKLESVRLRRYPLHYDGSWRVDMDALARAAGARTRAIVVVHPNNPTGSFLDDEEIEALRALAAERFLAIVSDEVFADYRFDDASRPLTLAGESGALTFSLGGLSKAAGLPQMKLAWIVASGPAALRDEALARLEIIGDTFLSVGTPVQAGLEGLLSAGDAVRVEILARLRANRAALFEAAGRGAAWECLHADGGWYAVLRVPRVRSDEEWALDLLGKDGVLVHPGALFDFAGEGYLVVSLLPEPVSFREGIARLRGRIAEGA